MLLQPIAEAVNKALGGESTAKQLIDEIITCIREAESNGEAGKQTTGTQSEAKVLHQAIRLDLNEMFNSLTAHINGVTAVANVTLETAEKTLKVAEDLKGGTNDLISKVGNVTSVADKIASTTQSYRDALVSRQPPSHKTSIDPKVLGDIDRKAKQILIDVFNNDDDNTPEKSLAEHIDKANEVISKMTDAKKPTRARVESASISRKGAILLTLDSKETVAWIREPENEMTFADSFVKGAHIRDRVFSLIAPSIPLTFEPDNATHLREIEEANNLPSRVIRKARWIKPIGRRRPGQTHAYAIMSLSSVVTANKIIKDGVVICGKVVRPTKQKQEPAQCMKCRRWGHFAAYCLDADDTCGTCGGKHRTSACENKEKLHCVSCGDNSHASWDRACPEFTKRCAILDERNPLNSMPFFPTEQDWTLVSRPSRIPLEERFPEAYAVKSRTTTAHNPTGSGSQRKAATHRATKAPRAGNPNLIPLPAKSDHTPREAGEITGQERNPSWLNDPANRSKQVYAREGDHIPNTDKWI